MNERPRKNGGGFYEEIKKKFPAHAAAVFRAFSRSLYPRLPLGALVGGSVLIVHGGMSRHRHVALAQLRSLDTDEASVPEAPDSYDECAPP